MGHCSPQRRQGRQSVDYVTNTTQLYDQDFHSLRVLGTTEITKLEFRFVNFLPAHILRQYTLEHGLFIIEPKLGINTTSQKPARKRVMNTTTRQGREAEVITLDHETLKMKRGPIHQLQPLRRNMPQAPAIQIYPTKIRKSVWRPANDPKRSIRIKLLTPRLRRR